MKNKFLILGVLLLLTAFRFDVNNKSRIDKKIDDVQQRVTDLMSQMTVEEKVGQMTQITLQAVSKQAANGEQEHILDVDKLRDAITNYHIGSFLNVYDMAYDLEYWHEILTIMQDISTKETRLKIPILYGIDAIHGVTYTTNSTLFPQSIAMAATRNKELVEKSAEITAIEMKASGIPWDFNPVLGMGREPMWSRFWETFGEDVYLTTEMGKRYVRGIQGEDPAASDRGAACMKHYLGYSVPKSGQDRTPAWIPERQLREIFLPPFQAAVDEGVLTVMVNSAEINGIPAHSDHFLLTELLKEELGFKGFIVSDWEDVKRLYDRDKIASTPKEAVKLAVMAGLDMSMVPQDFSFYEYLVELVHEGEVPMERIDDAVRRILTVKAVTGVLDNPYPDKEFAKNFGKPEFKEINLEAAREAITLVRNENTLPLNKDMKVLVTGTTANRLSVLNGGWTITWQGNQEKSYPHEKFTVLEAVQDKIGEENVVFVDGNTTTESKALDKAVQAAANVDAVILCLGEETYCETPGNIKDLKLDPAQLDLAAALENTGKPVIIVMLQGRPRVIEPIVEESEAILVAMLPGMEGGQAIADIIFGDANPSGKLPFTYPKYTNGLTTYDHKFMENSNGNIFDPQWEFGFGLSYTKFEYGNPVIEKDSFSKDENIKVSVTVKNTGDREGKEAVELYLSDLYASVSRPVKQLKGFEKISLKPGEEKVVNFTITPYDLTFIGRDNKRISEAGDFELSIDGKTVAFSIN